MKKLDSKSYRQIRLWMYRNARQLELAIWQYEFEQGGKEAVLSALTFYQNEDGGFGNILEPDSWNPDSSPYTTLNAINILKTIDFFDGEHPIIQGIFRFLESGAFCTENGWLFCIPSNNGWAHAPWWTYDSKANEVENIGLTAEIVSFIMKFADGSSALYKKALQITGQMIENLKTLNHHGDMGIGGYCVLADTIKQTGLTGQFDHRFLSQMLKALVFESIERDTLKWPQYGVRPSNYINTPGSIYYKDNADIVQKELDYLIETRPNGGVWDITWSWYENNQKYAKEFTISENWWKGINAIQKVRFLRNFGRLN